MDCPKCVGRLEEKIIEEVKVDVCWSCEGMWFDKSELENVLIKDAHDLKKIDLGRDEFDGKEMEELQEKIDMKTGNCPRCGDKAVLTKEGYAKGVIVDACSVCGGVWLDAGEIHQLRNRLLVKIFDKLYSFKEGIINKMNSSFIRPV